MARLTSWLLLLAWGGAASVSAQGLHELAVKSGKLFFGTATDTNLFNDAAYMAVLNKTGEFGLVVPENSQKWDATEKTQNEFQFTNPDSVRAVAQANKQMMRCHALTWHSQLPQFVSTGTWTPETLTPVIQAHISNVVTHYKGACYSWDVVNEALADNGTLRDSVFSRTLGADFIPISFKAAAAADPAAKLYYNDFSLEFNSHKTDGAVKIVQDLKAANVKIDGIGFQSHFQVGKTPSQDTLNKVMTRFTDLGLEVALTELDVRHDKLPADDAAIQQQAKDYGTVVKTCVDNAKCVGIVVWEFTDKYSWIPSTFSGAGDACLFDKDMKPKPAYTAVAAALGGPAVAAAPVAAPAPAAGAQDAEVVLSSGSSESGAGAGIGATVADAGTEAEADADSGAGASSNPKVKSNVEAATKSPSSSGTPRFEAVLLISPLVATASKYCGLEITVRSRFLNSFTMVYLKTLVAAAASAGLAQASLSGLDKIPPLGLGTWLSDKSKVADAVAFAVGEVGYNHIDAALIYRNEDQTGKGLASSGVARKDVWVTSKLWNTDHRADRAVAAIKKSISDLGVDYLDLYLIHWPVAFIPDDPNNALDRETTLVDTWKTLEGFVKANLTRHIGLSNFAKADVETILKAAEIKPYAHEFETHPYLQQQEFVDWHKEKGIEVIAYSPLANTNPTYSDDLPAIYQDKFWVDVAAKKGVSVFQAVLAWGIQRGTSVIPKSTKDSHIISNRKALEIEFTEEELKEIAKQDKKHRLSNPGAKWGVKLFADLDDPGRNEPTSEEL
ncbi:aldo/keto reductase [Colletotrichum paranaense]|uniref:Aldo/keto reductase n=1 Tax=Colletotrichum paranaense TaxID=1914294 RepID=A0ABQ9T2E7_9PEZI|nr:aldo/keto reductase [Colletotrichum paranaense]KAK1545933.1 aldo/keto reductase [Colletotrichum paranaense]